MHGIELHKFLQNVIKNDGETFSHYLMECGDIEKKFSSLTWAEKSFWRFAENHSDESIYLVAICKRFDGVEIMYSVYASVNGNGGLDWRMKAIIEKNLAKQRGFFLSVIFLQQTKKYIIQCRAQY